MYVKIPKNCTTNGRHDSWVGTVNRHIATEKREIKTRTREVMQESDHRADFAYTHCGHTHTQPFYSTLDFVLATRVSRYQKKHSPTHTDRGHQSSLICILHLLWSIASSLFNLRALQSFSTISLQVFFGLPLGLAPSTSYSIHFFTQSLSSFHNTCPYHRNLFCCSTKIMSSNPSFSLNPLLYLVA